MPNEKISNLIITGLRIKPTTIVESMGGASHPAAIGLNPGSANIFFTGQ